MNKSILNTTSLRFTNDFPGLRGVNIMATQFPIEPFLVFTEFYMDKPVFGPHPHAGISVMTYMLPDSQNSFINRDSNGDFSIIEPGGIHITQAGSGIHHDEFPQTNGVMTHGFQIWINHAEKNRMIPPKAMHAMAYEIPELITDAYRVRVLHGQFEGSRPAYKMVTDVTLLHVFLQPNKSIELSTAAMAFVYCLEGSGQSMGQPLSPQTLVNYEQAGDTISLQATEKGLAFMMGSGTPLKEQITYGGPFVMTTPEQMAKTRLRYGRGEMGTLAEYRPS